MSRRVLIASAASLLLASLVVSSGCNMTYGPRLGMFGYPIPLSPYFQDQEEDKLWWSERYEKVPILEPLAPGVPAIALDPPSQDEIMRVLDRSNGVEGGIPFIYEKQRNGVRIVVEQIADSVDPPRVYPLIGPAQLHHARFKCTVYFSKVLRVGWPIPYTHANEDAREVIYVDHDHLHMVGNVDTGSGIAS